MFLVFAPQSKTFNHCSPVTAAIFGTMSRPRAKDSDYDEVTAILLSFLSSPTKLQYGEDPSDRLQSNLLKKWGALLVKLRGVQPNLCFCQNSMASCMAEVAETKGWELSKTEKEEMSHRIARRVRLMCSHFSKGSRRKAKPKWVLQIEAMDGLAPLPAKAAASASSDAAAPAPAAEVITDSPAKPVAAAPAPAAEVIDDSPPPPESEELAVPTPAERKLMPAAEHFVQQQKVEPKRNHNIKTPTQS